MKKLFIFAAAILAFCGCDDKDDPADQPVEDAITIAPESETFGSKGGKTEVVVTSSANWTLTGDYDWVTPSAISGKDGDIVKFTVAANETDADKTAEFTFTVGKKSAKFTVISKKMGTVVDKVSVSPKDVNLTKQGGATEVIVTSSDAWTLTGDYDWVTPSAKAGKDGDVVTFNVVANEAADGREAVFTFTVGKESAEFKLTQDGGISVELVSEKDVTVLEEGGEGVLEIRLNSEMSYRELAQAISAEGEGWLTYAVTLAGSDDCTAKMYFNVTANEAYESRSAVITISAGNAKVEVNVTQRAKTRLETDEEMIIVGLDAQSINIPIRSNVAYKVLVDPEAQSWITYSGKSGDNETFAIAAGEARRQGKIVFDSDSKSLEVIVMQKPDAIINFSPYFGYNRAWPAWNDPTPVDNMTAFTMEALVNSTQMKSYGSLSTIMGIEGYFLIRLGDVGYPAYQIQVVYPTKDRWGDQAEGKLTNTDMRIPDINTWYHIAVTFDGSTGTLKCYIDGKEVGSVVDSNFTTASFGVPHNDESDNGYGKITRCFWVGYAYDSGRDFRGMMSELRIWNKALTPEEINAPNHFYQVEPTAEGLVTYWKCNEGKGNVIKDHTAYGNDLSVESDLDWRVVSVPE